ncbi:MAG: tetratricopeptide repeat protein [Dictyoglomaceae bacterium]
MLSYELYSAKLFKNDPLIRYEKTIHETVNYSLARLGYVPAIKGIYIHHYRYLTDPENLIKKSIFYRDLLYFCHVFLRIKGKYQEAIDVLKVALSKDQGYWAPTIHNSLGLLYMSLNAPYFVHSWVNLGIAYEKTRRFGDALDCYIKAYQLDPELFNRCI